MVIQSMYFITSHKESFLLEGCLLIRVGVVVFLLQGLWLVYPQVLGLIMYQLLISSCKVGLKHNQNVIGYSHNVQATPVSVGMSCKTSHYCNTQGSQLVKTDHYLATLHSIFKNCDSQAVEMMLIGLYHFNIFMLYDLSMWCLQQQSLTAKIQG